ncbi:MAG TPA: hypothetical protein PKA74_14140 [Bauldia sp.]|nr:hypothetical protein [Bauldia sp.]
MTDTIDPATFKALQETAGADFVGELVGAFVEEALEIIGIVLLILAVLDHFGRSGRVALDLDR